MDTCKRSYEALANPMKAPTKFMVYVFEGLFDISLSLPTFHGLFLVVLLKNYHG
jgi:hypothetical protein